MVIVACLLIAAIGVAIRWPSVLLYATIFLAPWEGLAVDIGARITAYRLLATALVFGTVIRLALRHSGRRLSVVAVLGLSLAAYATFTTVLQLPSLPEGEIDDDGFRSGWYRPFLQVFTFVIDLGVVYSAALGLRDHQVIWRAGRLYVQSCLVLAGIGWLQLGIWYTTGSNPLPIDVVIRLFQDVTNSDPHIGMAFHEGIPLYRMNSFGWEPRNLSGSFAMGLLLLQMVGSVRPQGVKFGVVWGVLFVSMLFTLSTSGVVLWSIGSLLSGGVVAIRGFGDRIGRARLKWSLNLIGLIVVAMMSSVYLLSLLGVDASAGVRMLLLRGRAIERDFVFEDFDEAVVRLLIERPEILFTGVGLGAVHLYAEPHLPAYASYAQGTAFRAKSGALYLLSELGLVGSLLFVSWYIMAVLRLAKITATIQKDDEARSVGFVSGGVARFAMVSLFLFLLRGHYIGPQVFIALAAVVALLAEVAAMARKRGSGAAFAGTSGVIKKVLNP